MSYRNTFLIWLSLLVLLGVSLLLVSFMPGTVQRVISFSCAAAIAILIMVFYMRLSVADGILRIFALGGLLWLVFLIMLTLLEVMTR